MTENPKYWSGSALPPEAGRIQLTVQFEVFHDNRGGCAVTFSAPEGSALVEKYGGTGRALAACRDVIVDDLDRLIVAFHDEE